MGGASLILALITAAHAACDDPKAAVEEALNATLFGDYDGAHDALGKAEAAFGCGALAEKDTLVEFWIVEGSLAFFQNDVQGMKDSFAAAASLSPEGFNQDLGPTLYGHYQEAAKSDLGIGTIDLKPALENYVGALDGNPKTFPAETTGGLHLLQVGKSTEEMLFSKIVWVPSGDTSVVQTGIKEEFIELEETIEPEETESESVEPAADSDTPAALSTNAVDDEPAVNSASAETEGVSEPTLPDSSFGVHAYIGVGSELIVGTEAEDLTLSLIEPSVKLGIPLFAGIELRPSALWLRAEFGVVPLTTGTFLYSKVDDSNTYDSTKSAFTTSGFIGAQVKQYQFGGGLVLFFPSRIGLRASAGMQLGELPIYAEIRPGLNLTTDTKLEFAATAMFSYRPRLN